MAQGIKLPLQTKNGRLQLLSGDEYIEQLIFTALGDNESENPFQDIGLGEFMIFGINDSYTEGEIRTRVEQIFDLLEGDQLARLDSEDKALTFTRKKGTGQLVMLLSYTNLETQEQREIEVPIPSA